MPVITYREGMVLHFTPEQQAQLAQLATKAGTDPKHLVMDAALRLLAEDARFRATVREGIAQADRGEFIEEEEMDARFEEMLRSWMRIRWTLPPQRTCSRSVTTAKITIPISSSRPCASCMTLSEP